MENQAHGLTTDSTVNKRFSSVKQAGFMSMFKSSSVKRTACAIAFAVACVPTIALGEGISKLPAVSGQATISQAATSRPAAEPTDTKTAETVASKVLPSVVSVKATSDSSGSTGSGVVLNTNGDILTNYHVIEGMDTFSISVNDKEYECTVVGTDPTSDLAVLHADLKGDSLTPIEIGNSDNLAPGSWVMSVGSPFGLDHSVSAGIVSALSRGDMLETVEKPLFMQTSSRLMQLLTQVILAALWLTLMVSLWVFVRCSRQIPSHLRVLALQFLLTMPLILQIRFFLASKLSMPILVFLCRPLLLELQSAMISR